MKNLTLCMQNQILKDNSGSFYQRSHMPLPYFGIDTFEELPDNEDSLGLFSNWKTMGPWMERFPIQREVDWTFFEKEQAN